MKLAIIIPARYGSTRFPGKPLARIGAHTMLGRVADVARKAAKDDPQIDVMITTEDTRIAAHADKIGVQCIITDADCPTGSDRVLAAVRKAGTEYDYLINLQGDTPFTPPGFLTAIIDYLRDDKNPQADVITPVYPLTWEQLDALRSRKQETPFSGTTAILAPDGRALWFSKNILPAIRKEDRTVPFSPVYQHVGLYGYRRDVLEQFVSLPQSHYEKLEGLEQLRFIENGFTIQTVKVSVLDGFLQGGIDSPEDLKRAEAFLEEQA